MDKKYVLALDQGTTSSRAILFDRESNIAAVAIREFRQIYPQAGWVEHDPLEIWESQHEVIGEVLFKSRISPDNIAAIGITNQRETTIVWDRNTGMPVYNAIVWQCRRTAGICDELKERGLEPYIRENTGLLLDAYFSGTKLKWILDNVNGVAEKAAAGDLLFGTVDSWLIWKLTGGKVHVTDYTNASRTMLFNIKTLKWDEKLLNELNIPAFVLPRVVPSSGEVGLADCEYLFGAKIPIAGIAGDQQSALFGQGATSEGDMKNTYGTGCFLLMNTGNKFVNSQSGLITTLSAQTLPEKPAYALEGSVFIGGAVVQWLRDELGFIKDSGDIRKLAAEVPDSGGVYVVPAFAGLGAPYWDMYARGMILGLTRGTGRAHIARAAVESIAWQSKDLIEAMKADSHRDITHLRVDGGAAVDDLMLQFQADITGIEVERPACMETTALGAAYLAGLAVGFWKLDELSAHDPEHVFIPVMDESERTSRYARWKSAVKCASAWQQD